MSNKYEEQDITYRGNVLMSATCDECGKDLEIGDWGKQHERFTKNTLGVSAGGGYHGYYDGNARIELCADCAKRLLAAFPSLERSFAEERGF